MAEKMTRLPSKIVQVEEKYVQGGHLAWMLCEDGSVWICNDGKNEYRQVHPPHQPPTQAADLAEALDALRNLVEWASVTPGCAEIESREAFEAAKSLLKKHGVGK